MVTLVGVREIYEELEGFPFIKKFYLLVYLRFFLFN